MLYAFAEQVSETLVCIRQLASDQKTLFHFHFPMICKLGEGWRSPPIHWAVPSLGSHLCQMTFKLGATTISPVSAVSGFFIRRLA